MQTKQQLIDDVEALRQEGVERIAQAEDLANQASAQKRDMTPDEQDTHDRLLLEAKAIQDEYNSRKTQAQHITNQQAHAVLRAGFNGGAHLKDLIARPAVAQVSKVRELWLDDPKKGFKGTRDFFTAVMVAGLTGKETEQLQYLRIRGTAGSDEHSTFSDPYGGYMVPNGLMPGMMRIDPEADPLSGRTMQVPLDVPVVNFVARVDKDHSTSVSGGLRVYRRAEADTVTSSRMQLELITLRANPLMGITYASEELLTDSPSSFIAIISAGFQDEFASKLLTERLSGTGVGEMLGVLNSPALIATTRTTSSDFVYTDALQMMARCWGFSNAVWLMNHTLIPKLGMMSVEVGAGGGPVFLTNAVDRMPTSLLGRPIIYTEYLPTLGSAGDVLLVNWSQYLEGTYQPLQSAESIHVRFLQAERAFRFTMRNDGAPWWRSVLTPKNGSTLSPYVTLAA